MADGMVGLTAGFRCDTGLRPEAEAAPPGVIVRVDLPESFLEAICSAHG
jgi:hypothetical protein